MKRTYQTDSSHPYLIQLGTSNLLKKNACFEALRGPNSRTHSHDRLRWAGWLSLFCVPTREPALVITNAGTSSEKYWGKMEGEWTREVDFRQKLLAEGEARMAWPARGFKGITLWLWPVNRGVLNFCVRNTPLRVCQREREREREREKERQRQRETERHRERERES